MEHKQYVLMMNMLQRAMIDRPGDGSVVQVEGLGGRPVPDVEHLQPQGVHFKAPVGAEGLLAAPGGVADTAVLVCASDRRSVPAEDIEEGEGGLHYLGAWKVFLAEDGTLHLGTKVPEEEDGDFVALASKVDAFIAFVDAVISTWVPVANDGGTALQTKWSTQKTAEYPDGFGSVASETVRCS